MPRWLPAVAVVSVTVLLAVTVKAVFFPPTNPRITQANFDQLTPGMTRADVEAILGPRDDYRTWPTRDGLRLRLCPPTSPADGGRSEVPLAVGSLAGRRGTVTCRPPACREHGEAEGWV
jgi:hypothetical protein